MTTLAEIGAFVADCQQKLCTYVVAPCLYLGKKVCHILAFREREVGEDKNSYYFKECIATTAKVIMLLAIASFVKAVVSFSVLLTFAGIVFIAARKDHLKTTISGFLPSLESVKEAVASVFEFIRSRLTGVN